MTTNQTNHSNYVRITDAAAELGVDRRTLATRCQECGVKIFIFGRKSRRILNTDLKRFKQEGITLYGDRQPAINKCR